MTEPLQTSLVPAAFVLAAGLGSRMQPLTRKIPKPLVPVLGRPILDWIFDRLRDARVPRVVMNAHHLRHHMAAYAGTQPHPALTLIEEPERLETGGGIVNGLHLFPAGSPFYAINGDSLWLDGATPALTRLREAWDDSRMDALLLLHRTVHLPDPRSRGDFFMDAAGLLRRRQGLEVSPHIFMGVQLLHPRLFAHAPGGAFSLNVLYDKALAAGRLYGMAHDGLWFHLSRPEDVSHAEFVLKHL
jgi:N-acetyl-alpha-D-muramate 1-phosphate uridylyltransferase